MVTLLECMHNTSLQCTAIFTKQKMSYNLDSLYILLSYFARRVKNNARTRRVVDPNQLSRRGTLPPTPGAETGFPFPLILSVRIQASSTRKEPGWARYHLQSWAKTVVHPSQSVTIQARVSSTIGPFKLKDVITCGLKLKQLK